MEQETFCLSSKSFQSQLQTTLKELFTENTFADVTLVSDDQIQIPAHKFVLSACSPVLKNLLLNNPHSHPLLYLRGVKQQELQSILQFMYLGEARIYQERINQFLDIAMDLQIEEFSQDTADEQAIAQEPVEPVAVDDSVNTDDTEYKSVSSTLDELLNLDITGFDDRVDQKEDSRTKQYECKKNSFKQSNRHQNCQLQTTRTNHPGKRNESCSSTCAQWEPVRVERQHASRDQELDQHMNQNDLKKKEKKNIKSVSYPHCWEGR